MRSAIAVGLLVVWCSIAHAHADCERDAQLEAAARALLRDEGAPAPRRIDAVLREVDSDLPHARALWLPRADPDRRRRWLREVAGEVDAPLVCGRAETAAGAVLYLTAPRAARLEVLADAPLRLKGWLRPGHTRARLFFSSMDGRMCVREVTRRRLATGVTSCLQGTRATEAQLVASGASGPRPVARCRAGDASAVALVPVVAASPSVHAALHTLRAKVGITGKLRIHRALEAVAGRHARRSCRRGRVGHVSTPEGDPEARLRREGVNARVVGEVVARAESVAAAFLALQRSPSHRWTLLERRFTDVGIGTAQDAGGRACLVILLAAWPRAF